MLPRATPLAVILGLTCLRGLLFADELEPEVQSALAANAEALSELRIEGHRERRFLINANQGLKKIGTLATEKEFTQPVKFALKLQRDRLYESIKYPPGKYHTDTENNERCFDGAKYFSGTADPTNSSGILIIHSPETQQDQAVRESPGMRIFELWYLEAAGFEGPVRGEKLGQPIRSLLLSRIESGTLVSVRRTTEGGRQLVEVLVRYPDPWAPRVQRQVERGPDIQPFKPESMKLQKRVHEERRGLAGQSRECQFLLDPAYNYAVREMSERRDSSPVMFHTKCDDFTRLEGTDLWLPRRCETVSSAYGLRPTDVAEEPIYVTSIQVNEIARETFTDVDFRLWYDFPGATVADYTDEKAEPGRAFEYSVPASADDLAKAAERGRGKRWLIIVNVLMVVLFIAVIAWKRIRATHS